MANMRVLAVTMNRHGSASSFATACGSFRPSRMRRCCWRVQRALPMACAVSRTMPRWGANHKEGNAMKLTRRRLGGIVAGTVLAMPAIRTHAADAIQLKFATADTMQDTSYSVAQHFADEVAHRTNGKYATQIFVNGALGTALNLANS